MWKENTCLRNSPIPNIYSAEIHVKFYIFVHWIFLNMFSICTWIYFFSCWFSPYHGHHKNARAIKILIPQKTKRQVLCLKGVRGHQIIKRAEYSLSTCKHAFEQCFICIVLSFCWMTLWPVGFNYKH